VETETTESTCISKHLPVFSSNSFTHFLLFAHVHVRRMRETPEWPLINRTLINKTSQTWRWSCLAALHVLTLSFISLLDYLQLINTSGDTASRYLHRHGA